MVSGSIQPPSLSAWKSTLVPSLLHGMNATPCSVSKYSLYSRPFTPFPGAQASCKRSSQLFSCLKTYNHSFVHHCISSVIMLTIFSRICIVHFDHHSTSSFHTIVVIFENFNNVSLNINLQFIFFSSFSSILCNSEYQY